ncbi:MAG: sodium:solute symporter family protein [Thermoprotei archaeon]
MVIAVIVLALYFVVGSLIAVISRRAGIKSTFDYYVAGYRLGGLLAAMTYAATTYSAFMMIGLVGFAYATGIGAFGFENLYLLATVFLLALFAHKVWRMARERKWISPAEMIGDLYGSKLLAAVIAVVYLVALIPYSTAQLVGIGNLFEGLGLGYLTGVIAGAFIVFLWIYLAGIWSVATTDAYQGIWMIAAALGFIVWITGYLLPSNGLDVGKAFEVLGGEGYLGITSFWAPSVFLAFTLPWIFFAVTNPQVVQRLYMPRDEKALNAMIRYFAVFGLVYTVIVTLIGLFARALTITGVFPNLENRDLTTPTLLSMAHPLLSAIVFTSIVAAAISTLDSIILTLASCIQRDVYRGRGDSRRELIVGYIVIVVLVAITSIVALLRPGFVVELSVLSSVLLLPLAPVTITAWITPEKVRDRYRSALTAITIGFGIGVYAALVYGPRKAFIQTILGLPISLWILLVSSAILVAGLSLEERV